MFYYLSEKRNNTMNTSFMPICMLPPHNHHVFTADVEMDEASLCVSVTR